MSEKLLHRIIGGCVFFIAGLVYFLTVQPSVSFWDCGEFIASADLMQVPHPPGTPFFLILGRFFSMIPFADNIAFRVNTVSVLSSAFTILFAYLVAVKLIQNYKQVKHESLLDALFTYLSAAIGALSLAFAQTFWFNAVEAEVYAFSTFFIGIVTWLIMVWFEKADEPDSEKYIILIFYLIGLATGVHLMAVLAIVPIMMMIMIRKYMIDESEFKSTVYIFLGHAGIILLVGFAMWAAQDSSSIPTQEEYKAVDLRFLITFVVITVVYMGIFYKRIFSRNSFYVPIILGGIALVAVYPGIVKYVTKLVTMIGGDHIIVDSLLIAGILAGLLYLLYYTKKEKKETFNLVVKSFLFAFIGFSSYAMIIIRANQDPPINLNSPKTFSEVVSYLNRDQYGDFPTFKRRFTGEPSQQVVYNNYSSDLDFLWTYQMNHMFTRYLLWNYAGRTSTNQDDGIDIYPFNSIGNFLGAPFGLTFRGDNLNSLYAIPFLLGLLGVYFHFKKDWKMASVFMVMFIFLGLLTAFYQNQQEPQPRERDYFYVGAFFVYSIWIALGVRGIIDLIGTEVKNKALRAPISAITIVLAFLFVPANMLATNYHEQNRSNNFVPWDYSYNLLQSVAPNAILFTNGDNDTFPLWYLQDVEGVRRDVRIANLSLMNTPWYILQLKNTTPHGAKKVEMSMSDADIERINPVRFDPMNISVDVPQDLLEKYQVTDTSMIKSGKLTWRMNNTVTYGNIKAVRVQDLVVLDIIRSHHWERPIYFAATVSDDSKIDLDNYLEMEGLAFRLVPKRSSNPYTFVNEEILHKQLFNEPEGFSKDYQPGFKFRGLDDPTIFFDSNHQRLTQNYRSSFLKLAFYYLNEVNQPQKAVETLDEMEQKIPRHNIEIDYRILFDVGNMYYEAGSMDKYNEIAAEVEGIALQHLERDPTDFNTSYNPYRLLLDIYEKTGQYAKALDVISKIETYLPGDPSVQNLKSRFQRLMKSADTSEVTADTIPQPKN